MPSSWRVWLMGFWWSLAPAGRRTRWFERVINELGPDQIIGVVLNRVEDDLMPATGYYQHYYAGTEANRVTGGIWLPLADQSGPIRRVKSPNETTSV